MLSVLLGAVLFILDFYNILTQLSDLTSPVILTVGLLSTIIITFCWLFHIHFFGLITVASANIFDGIFIVLFFATLTYCIFNAAFLHSAQLIVSIAICLFCLLLILSRVIFYTYSQRRAKVIKTNVVDLKDVYNNAFNYTEDGPILIEEADADYDLLNRGHLINWVVYSIQNCRSSQSFVIGLEGPWGSGKTTILNNVKRILNSDPKELHLIKNFDPWAFGTQEALLWGMYDAIFKSSGTKFSILQSHHIMEHLSSAVVDGYAIGRVIKPIAFDTKTSVESLSEIKRKISSYLQIRNQIVVFFIDNIDRADAKNVIFLFKLIGTIFSLPKIIYVLSYDRERINKIFNETNDMDSHYIDKIIQQEIKVPIITKNQIKTLYSACIENIFLAYGVEKENQAAYLPLLQYICSEVKDLRQFKRLINSAFSMCFCQKTKLYKPDLLAIEVIRFIAPDAYFEIYRSRNYFISHDIVHDMGLWQQNFEKEKFNGEGKAFFNSFLSTKKSLLELLATMFPYVLRYKQNQDIIADYAFSSDQEYSNISNNMRICSGKYFDLYFSYTSNDYMSIHQSVLTFLNNIHSHANPSYITDELETALTQTPDGQQKEWFEQLQSQVGPCIVDYRYLPIALFNMIYNVDDSLQFLSLSARRRCALIIAQGLSSCSEQEFAEFLSNASYSYGKIEIIREIIYWYSNKNTFSDKNDPNRKSQLTQLYNSLCKTILEKSIDLYSDEYYHQKNILGLYSYCSESDPQIFKQYIATIVSKDNIYRVLWDIITQGVGEEYLYSIDKKNIDIFFNDVADAEVVLQARDPQNSSEKFVKEVFLTFRYGKGDILGNKSVTSTTEIKPIL